MSFSEHTLSLNFSKSIGMQELLLTIQSKVLEVTGRRVIKFRVPNGGEEYRYLFSHVSEYFVPISDRPFFT